MKLYPSFTPDLADWASRQPVFFTGSAPSSRAGHVNVSPKGLATSHFAVLSPTRCAYVDRTGSGCETIAHAYDNGRLTLMWNSFGPAPRILRVFGRASVVEHDDPRFEAEARKIMDVVAERRGEEGEGSGNADTVAAAEWPGSFEGARAIIICDIREVQTTCGFAVPMVCRQHALVDVGDDENDNDRYDERTAFQDRPTLDEHSHKIEQRGRTLPYRAEHNAVSMDGLPGLRSARRDAGEVLWLTDARASCRRALEGRGEFVLGVVVGMVMMALLILGERLLADGLPTRGV